MAEALITILWLILLGIVWGLICYKLAEDKNRGKILAFFMGYFFGIFAVVYYGLVGKRGVPCPQCKETINKEARICPHCRSKIKE